MDDADLNALRNLLWGPELLTLAGMAFYGKDEWEAVMKTHAFQKALAKHVERMVHFKMTPLLQRELWVQFARSRVTMEIIRWEGPGGGTAVNIKVYVEDPEMAEQAEDGGDPY